MFGSYGFTTLLVVCTLIALIHISTAASKREILTELGVPEAHMNDRIIVLSNDAHLDWDWLYPHEWYLKNGSCVPDESDDTSCRASSDWTAVETIFLQAFKLLAKYQNHNPSYFYSICEMMFLKETVDLHPEMLDNFHDRIGDKLRIIGGGMVSPDHLLPAGEAFIRNYLLGSLWMKDKFHLPLKIAYFPDNFGNGDQLPVMLQSMGFMGVAFGRIPKLLQNADDAVTDFYWTASDGSSVLAHWMPGNDPCPPKPGYNQGHNLWENRTTMLVNDWLPNIYDRRDSTQGKYVYIPVGGDFAWPIHHMLEYTADYNSQDESGVYTVVGTLDHYMQLIANLEYIPSKRYAPNPYWSGYYGSRPVLKILHHQTVPALLATETFVAMKKILSCSNSRAFEVDDLWQQLVFSTHHDYITGTAVDNVYHSEQLPLSRRLIAAAIDARNSAGEALALCLSSLSEPKSEERPILILNSLGFNIQDSLVELPVNNTIYDSIRFSNGDIGPVQLSKLSNQAYLIFQASAASIGGSFAYLFNKKLTSKNHQLNKHLGYTSIAGKEFILENEYVKAVINDQCKWGLASVYDKKLNRHLLQDGQCGNKLKFYRDNGGMYRFGNEASTFVDDTKGKITVGDGFFVENGPIRSTIRTFVDFESPSCPGVSVKSQYVREYSLVKGEPFIRMSINGSAPLYKGGTEKTCGYSIFTHFPLRKKVAPLSSQSIPPPQHSLKLIHGTPYHWTDYQPEKSVTYDPPVFRSVHDYWIAVSDEQADEEVAGALYHKGTLAWAIDAGSGAEILGSLFRNNPNQEMGAAGTDNQSCTHQYAFRTPYGLGLDSTTDLTLLKESKKYQQQLQAYYISPQSKQKIVSNSTQIATSNFSLLAADSGAIISAFKLQSQPQDLASKQQDQEAIVFRVYQGTNSLRYTNITLPFVDSPFRKKSSTKWKISEISALEDAKEGAPKPKESMDPVTQVRTQYAITSFQLL